MSMATPKNNASFGLQTRLFVALKRAGRIIDLVWFQQNAEYARTILALAEESTDDEIREIAGKLRDALGEYVAAPKVAVLSVAKPIEVVPLPVTVAAVVQEEEEPKDRYVASLR